VVEDPVITHEFGIEDTLTAFATAKGASVSSKVLLRL
jgi:L-iditol 2-dehydrogenase/L-idonate 5-dehydrogenase